MNGLEKVKIEEIFKEEELGTISEKIWESFKNKKKTAACIFSQHYGLVLENIIRTSGKNGLKK